MKIKTELALGIIILVAIVVGGIIWLSGRQPANPAPLAVPTPSVQQPAPAGNNCVKLGEIGPNGSLGPNDPNKGKACCEGLAAKSLARCVFVSKTPGGGCTFFEGCASTCLACGDGKCDSKYENRCNCPEDCKQ